MSKQILRKNRRQLKKMCREVFGDRQEILRLFNNYQQYLSYEGSKVSYYAGSRPEEKYELNRRRSCSLQKYIAMKTGLDASCLETPCKTIMSRLECDTQVYRGDDLVNIYRYSKFGQSCMTGPSRFSFLDLYRINPEIISLATLKSGKDYARALLWDYGDVHYVDRIYHSSSSTKDRLLEWAKKNGYTTSYERYSVASLKCLPEYTIIDLKNPTSREYPYMDTFYCVTRECSIDIGYRKTISLSNYLPPSRSAIKLRSCYGNYHYR